MPHEDVIVAGHMDVASCTEVSFLMAQMVDPNDWVVDALCAGDPPDALFVRGAAQRQAKSRCVECPVRLQCLADALQWRCDFGIWGGLTERERRALRRRCPQVDNWIDWLQHSDDELAVELRGNDPDRIVSVASSACRSLSA